jgi:hypothetical protein
MEREREGGREKEREGGRAREGERVFHALLGHRSSLSKFSSSSHVPTSHSLPPPPPPSPPLAVDSDPDGLPLRRAAAAAAAAAASGGGAVGGGCGAAAEGSAAGGRRWAGRESGTGRPPRGVSTAQERPPCGSGEGGREGDEWTKSDRKRCVCVCVCVSVRACGRRLDGAGEAALRGKTEKRRARVRA